MGREIKRVQLDFDWPIGKGWPPYMGGICSDDVKSCMGLKNPTDLDVTCGHCKHAAKLAGVEAVTLGRCPKWVHDPLPGDCYQLWETVSEGSPVSPVFATPEELADWMVAPGNDTSITRGTTREQWLAMICGSGYAPSLVFDEKGIRAGTQI